MGREVYIDGKKLDVMIDDNIEITYENSALQSVSDFKMSYTNTYTLPLTDKNRAIFDAIDNVNSETSFARKFHSLHEYRDGVPVIEDARVRLKTTKPNEKQIDIEVIWGALKSLADEIGKGNINDLPSHMIAWDDTAHFTTDEFQIGYLSFMSIANVDAGNANLVRHVKYTLPSVRVDYIIDTILSEKVSTPYSISDSLYTELKKYYIPCISMNGVTKIPDTNKVVLTPVRSSTIFRWGWQPYDRCTMNPSYSMEGASLNATYQFLQLTKKTSYFVNAMLTVTHPDAVTGDILDFRLGYNTGSSIKWEKKSEPVYFNGTTAIIDFTGDFTTDSERSEVEIFTQIVWTHAGHATRLEFGNTGNTVTCTGTITYWKKEGDGAVYGQDFDAILNLPKISQMDFLKNILAITGSYVYFKNGVINFDLIDNILNSSPLNIEKWITTLKSESIEYTYEDYARTNIYAYLDDDSILIDANSSINIEDETLDEEKEVVNLKLGASDPAFYDIASVPYFTQPADNSKDPTFVSSLKPRILAHRLSTSSENPEGSQTRRVGVFDDSMMWANILENKYKLFRSILSDPKVVEIELYMQKGDLYLINTNKIYYFWGANWILIDLTVSADGSGTGKFIQLN